MSVIKLPYLEAEQLNLAEPARLFITTNYDPTNQLMVQQNMQMFKLVEENRNGFRVLHMGDQPDKLTKLKEAYLNNYRHFSCFHKFLAFGPQPSAINVAFAWKDGFSNQLKESVLPSFEMCASLYNCAVATMDQAGRKDTQDDEQLRIAFLFYRQAAWLFDYLLCRVPAEETVVSLSREVLTMSSNLCQAYAQNLYLLKMKRAQ